MCVESENTATKKYCRVHTLLAGCEWRGLWWLASATTIFGSGGCIIWSNRNCRWDRNTQSSGEPRPWIGHSSDRTERSHCVHSPSRSREVRDVEIWCAQSQVVKRDSRDHIAEPCWQDEPSQDNSTEHNEVFAWQFGSLWIIHQRGGEADSCMHLPHVESTPQMRQRQPCCMRWKWSQMKWRKEMVGHHGSEIESVANHGCVARSKDHNNCYKEKEQEHNWLQTVLKAILVILGALLYIKLSEQTGCCQLRQWRFLRTHWLMSVTKMSITLESCGTEASALQSISVCFDGGRKVRPSMELMCVEAIPSETGRPCALEIFQHWGQSTRKIRWFRRYASIVSVSHVDGTSGKPTSHLARSSQDHCILIDSWTSTKRDWARWYCRTVVVESSFWSKESRTIVAEAFSQRSTHERWM